MTQVDCKIYTWENCLEGLQYGIGSRRNNSNYQELSTPHQSLLYIPIFYHFNILFKRELCNMDFIGEAIHKIGRRWSEKSNVIGRENCVIAYCRNQHKYFSLHFFIMEFPVIKYWIILHSTISFILNRKKIFNDRKKISLINNYRDEMFYISIDSQRTSLHSYRFPIFLFTHHFFFLYLPSFYALLFPNHIIIFCGLYLLCWCGERSWQRIQKTV